MRIGRCDICMGRRRIDLPVYEETVSMDAEPGPRLLGEMAMEKRETSRSYPCPECAKPRVPQDVGDKFTVIRANSFLNPELQSNPRYQESIRGGLAQRIARSMLECNGITFLEQRAPTAGPYFGRDNYGPPMLLEAVAGIVWPEGREIERIVRDFDPMLTRDLNDAPRGGIATAFDPDVGIGMRLSQTRKPKTIKLQRGTGRELIFDDEVKPDDEGQ